MEEELTSTAILAGELDFPDVVCKLDGEVNENERRVQLGLAKFMAVDEDASARDVLSAMEATWGLDRPGALFTLAGGVTNLKIHTVLAQVCTRCCTPAPAAPAAPPMHLLCTSPASPVRHPCAGAHAGLRQGDARHACMGDLWRGRRWRHVDDRHRHPQGGVMLGLDLVRPDPEPGPRPAPPTLPTPTLPTHPPEISQPSLPPPSPLPSAAPAMRNARRRVSGRRASASPRGACSTRSCRTACRRRTTPAPRTRCRGGSAATSIPWERAP